MRLLHFLEYDISEGLIPVLEKVSVAYRTCLYYVSFARPGEWRLSGNVW